MGPVFFGARYWPRHWLIRQKNNLGVLVMGQHFLARWRFPLLGEYVRVLLRPFRLPFLGISRSGTLSPSPASIEGKAPPKPVLVARDVFSLATRCRKVWSLRETEGDSIAQYVCPKSLLCVWCVFCVYCVWCVFCVMCWYGHYGCNLFYLCDDWLYLSVVQRVACHGWGAKPLGQAEGLPRSVQTYCFCWRSKKCDISVNFGPFGLSFGRKTALATCVTIA